MVNTIEGEFILYARPKAKGSSTLTFRTTNRRGSVKPGEVAVNVTVRLPASLFQKPNLRAKIDVDHSKVTAPVVDASVVENIKQTLESNLGMSVEIVVGK